jgi:prophage regulatory protein
LADFPELLRSFIAQIAQLGSFLSSLKSPSEVQMTHIILRRRAVEASVGLSRSTIYLRISKGTFPKPVSLGGRSVGWLQAEIDAWIKERIEDSRGAQ